MSNAHLEDNKSQIFEGSDFTDEQLSKIGFILAAFSIAIAIISALDLRQHWLPAQWHGTSAGTLGGVIGAFGFILYGTIDHRTLGLSAAGRGPAKREHVSFYKYKLVYGTISGFVLAVLAAHFFQDTSDAFLTAVGVIGGFSGTLLSSLSHAVDKAATRLANGKRQANLDKSPEESAKHSAKQNYKMRLREAHVLRAEAKAALTETKLKRRKKKLDNPPDA